MRNISAIGMEKIYHVETNIFFLGYVPESAR